MLILNASVAYPAATQYVPSELCLGLTGKFSVRKEPMLSGFSHSKAFRVRKSLTNYYIKKYVVIITVMIRLLLLESFLNHCNYNN